jgi:hypothetical protein
MTNKLTVVVALTAGLLGGLLTRYIAPPVAFAQDKQAVTKEVRAQSLTLVDASDHALGTFTAEPIGNRMTINGRGMATPQTIIGPTRIVLRDANGTEIWSAGGGARIRPLLESSR